MRNTKYLQYIKKKKQEATGQWIDDYTFRMTFKGDPSGNVEYLINNLPLGFRIDEELHGLPVEYHFRKKGFVDIKFIKAAKANREALHNG